MRLFIRLFAMCSIVCVALTLPGERDAAAEDVTAKIYDDVKDILQDLIRKEASKGIVRYMLRADSDKIDSADHATICADEKLELNGASDLDDIVAFYFHDAIERLYTGQLSSVGREMEIGLLDLLTDAMFYVVKEHAKFMGLLTTKANDKAKAKNAAAKGIKFEFKLGDIATGLQRELAENAKGYAWKLYRHLACDGDNRPELPDSTTLTASKCKAGSSGEPNLERAACSIARAVRAEVTDEPKEMEFYLQELAGVLFAAKTQTTTAVSAEDLFRSWALDSKSFEQKFTTFLGSSAAQQLGTADVSCPVLPSILGELKAAEKICWAWKLADKTTVDVPLSIQQCPTLKAHSAAELLEELRKTKAEDEASVRAALQRVFASTPPLPEPVGDAGAPPPAPPTSQPACNFALPELAIVVEKTPLAIKKGTALNPDVTATLKLLDKYLSNGAELRRVSAELGAVPAQLRSLDPLQQMDLLVRAQKLLTFLRRAHDYVTETGGSTHATAEPLSDLAYQAVKSACGNDDKELCSLAPTLQKLLGDYRFKDIARSGARGDLRSLATKVLEQVLPEVKDRETGLCKNGERCRKFIIAFAGYAVDMAMNRGDDKAARAAFKNAAEDILSETADERRAFPRKGEATVWWSTLLVPSASIRLSWSPDYFNGVGSDQFRTLMSIDWLTFLRWAPFRNVGLNLSLIDIAAPFTELAYRPRAHVKNGGYVALDFFRPRFDVIFAVPEFSRRLMLSAGISLKAYNTEIRAAEAGEDMPTITYRAMFDCKPSDTSCQGYRGAAEFNFGLKLVF